MVSVPIFPVAKAVGHQAARVFGQPLPGRVGLQQGADGGQLSQQVVLEILHFVTLSSVVCRVDCELS